MLAVAAGCKQSSGSPPTDTIGARAADNGTPDFSKPLPGAGAFPEPLVEKIKVAWAARDANYKPRTAHLNKDGSPKYTNRLFLESSPYLRQHAHNPLNWYPWGDEAFETAKKLHRPVLLSVGYSTCHWCHVMEEESFDDQEIARYLNENYVTIKVDREERPDVDAIYMKAVQMLTGSGGWPMTVWLTPDQKPFYGGTYFPARDGDRGARVGFTTLLRKLKEIYNTQADRVAQASAQLAESIQANLGADRGGQGLPAAPILRDAVQAYAKRFDSTYGGAGGAPKFPSNLPIRFLLRHYRRTGSEQSLKMATLTLEMMAAGGMYDHIGGGFHRYSTDARWLVPHFEKMLYDNALLAMDYLEALQVAGRQDFARVAREILRYVQRDMTSAEGAFYSASDADSPDAHGHNQEGLFYTWTPTEIEVVLGKDRGRIVNGYYAVTSGGNFDGRNILNTPKSLEDVAKDLKLPPDKVRSTVEESKDLLYAARSKRPPPARDDKILAAWNGLMISAHARAALILGEEVYARRAERAADFVLTRMRKDGRLLRSYKDGQGRHDAYLEDYAFMIAALLDLYEATSNPRWLQEAFGLDAVLESSYEDKNGGAFFLTSADHEKLLAREKPSYDGAEPSGNSVQAMNLLRLHEFTTKDRYRQRWEKTIGAFNQVLSKAPTAMSEMLLAVDFYLCTPKEVVIVAPASRGDAEVLLAQLRSTFLPNRIIAVAAQGEDLNAQAKLVPLLENKIAQKGKPTAYVCERGVCDLPTTAPDVFARQLRKVRKLDQSMAR